MQFLKMELQEIKNMTGKEKNWYDDVKEEGVEKGIAILPNFDLPNVGAEPMEFLILDEPYVIDTPKSPHNDTMTKMKVEHNGSIGEIIVPKSLKHSIAVSLEQAGNNFKEAKLTGLTLLVKQTKGNDGFNYYNCLLRKA